MGKEIPSAPQMGGERNPICDTRRVLAHAQTELAIDFSH